MINLIITLLILAFIAGILGFSGLEIFSISIARTLFFIFLILLAASLIWRALSGKSPRV